MWKKCDQSDGERGTRKSKVGNGGSHLRGSGNRKEGMADLRYRQFILFAILKDTFLGAKIYQIALALKSRNFWRAGVALGASKVSTSDSEGTRWVSGRNLIALMAGRWRTEPWAVTAPAEAFHRDRKQAASLKLPYRGEGDFKWLL